MSTKVKLEELDVLKGGNSASMSGIRRRLEKLMAREITVSNTMPKLADYMADEISVALDLRIKITEDGRYLGLVKRERDVDEEVLFVVGDSMMEVFIGFEDALSKGRWKESIPWTKS